MDKGRIGALVIGLLMIGLVVFAIVFDNSNKVNGPRISKCNTVPSEIIRVVEFGYNGHDYIEFVTRGGHCTVVHSPECHCLDDAKEVIDQMQTEYYD